MKSKFPFIRPTFPSEEALSEDLAAIVSRNWYTNFGEYEQHFCRALEQFIGQSVHVTTINSATSGLLAAVLALLGKGDGTKYVVIPSFTFVAGPQILTLCGFKPYFVDIDPRSLQVDSDQLRSILSEHAPNLAGLLLCSTFGVGAAAARDWEDSAAEHHLPLIIDSAAGFGSKYPTGEYLGARGDCEVFSFHATKPLAIGEGGAVASRHPDLIEKIRAIQNFGFGLARQSTQLGFNGKLQELNAAIGLRQLENFPERLKLRQAAFASYRTALEPAGIVFQDNADNACLCFASAIFPTAAHQQHALQRLARGGVQAHDYYNPLVHRQPVFSDHPESWAATDLRVTENIASRIVSLPIYDHMDPADLQYIIGLL